MRKQPLHRRVRWLVRDAGFVVRRTWWSWRGERQRVLTDNERLRASLNDAQRETRRLRDAMWDLGGETPASLSNALESSVDLHRSIADDIDCGGTADTCEHVGFMDPSTGVTECPRTGEDCPFDDAEQLRGLANALETLARVRHGGGRP